MPRDSGDTPPKTAPFPLLDGAWASFLCRVFSYMDERQVAPARLCLDWSRSEGRMEEGTACGV
jgi:hypothetical protein